MSARVWGRRRFLRALGAAAAALPGIAAWRGETRAARRHAEAVERIASTLSYLKVRREDILRFLEDHEKAIGPAPTDAAALPDLCGRFLLSTDFFMNGGDESRPIEYITLYDPYHSPCFNPLTDGLPGPGDRGRS